MVSEANAALWARILSDIMQLFDAVDGESVASMAAGAAAAAVVPGAPAGGASGSGVSGVGVPPPGPAAALGEDDELPEETPGYATSYAPLANAAKPEADPLPAVPDARRHLAAALGRLSAAMPGVVWRRVEGARLPPHSQANLLGYLSLANVTLQ